MERTESYIACSPITINSKCIKDQNVRAKTIKVIEKNTGVNLHDFGVGNGFLDVTPKTKANKEKNMLNFIKIKLVCP